MGDAQQQQQYLMELLIDQNFEDFQKLLERKNKSGNPLIDVNYIYHSTQSVTCLTKATEIEPENSAKFIRVLLEKGADPNLRIPAHSYCTAIHCAVENNNLPALKALLNHRHTDPNILNKKNLTPVYLAATFLPETSSCFRHLIFHPKVDITIGITKPTAVGRAAEKNCDPYLLQKIVGFHHENLSKRDKEIISRNYTNISYSKRNLVITTSDLYGCLEHNNPDTFMEEIEDYKVSISDGNDTEMKIKDLVNATGDFRMTLLQLACSKGYSDIVKFLEILGGDINASTQFEKMPPIHLACSKGDLGILTFLVNNGAEVSTVDGETLLHSIFKGLMSTKGDHKKCFDYLLENVSKLEIDVNQGDKDGHTALHFAVLEKDGHYAKELMKHGAYIGAKNVSDITPLHDMDPALLEDELDRCIEREYVDHISQQYNIRVNFKLLQPHNTSHVTENQNSDAGNPESIPLKTRDAEAEKDSRRSPPEIYPLHVLSQSKKLQHLLKHPVFLVFLGQKWKRISTFIIMDVCFFMLFVIFLTTNIFCITTDSSASPSSICSPKDAQILVVILYVLLIILIGRETLQFLMMSRKLDYFDSLENWLDLSVIVTTVLILIGVYLKFVTAFALILSWADLILHFGWFKSPAIYNQILKKVLWNYFKFLFLYLPLLLAFTLSFYKLSQGDEMEDGKSQQNADFFSSFVRTVVMMVGEFNAEDRKVILEREIIFLVFIFMITMVLSNLFNGLAVSDTQAIRNDAEMVILRSRVKLVYQFEILLSSVRWVKGRNLIGDQQDSCLITNSKQNKLIKKKDPKYVVVERAILDAANDITSRTHSQNETTQEQQIRSEISDIRSELSKMSNLLNELLARNSSE